MATTQVTWKLQAFDLQLIRDALEVYAEHMAAVEDARESGVTTMELIELPLYKGSPRYCAGQAIRLLAEVGLQTGAEREPQLEIWGDERVGFDEELEEPQEETVTEDAKSAPAEE